MMETLNKPKVAESRFEQFILEDAETIRTNIAYECQEIYIDLNSGKIDSIYPILDTVTDIVRAHYDEQDYSNLVKKLPEYILPYIKETIEDFNENEQESKIISDENALAMRKPFTDLQIKFAGQSSEVKDALDKVKNTLGETFTINDLVMTMGQVRRSIKSENSIGANFLQEFTSEIGVNSADLKQLTTRQLKDFLYSL
jgi:hypothetical protein